MIFTDWREADEVNTSCSKQKVEGNREHVQRQTALKAANVTAKCKIFFHMGDSKTHLSGYLKTDEETYCINTKCMTKANFPSP